VTVWTAPDEVFFGDRALQLCSETIDGAIDIRRALFVGSFAENMLRIQKFAGIALLAMDLSFAHSPKISYKIFRTLTADILQDVFAVNVVALWALKLMFSNPITFQIF